MASQNTFVISTGDKPTLEFEFDDVITDHVTDGIASVSGTPTIETNPGTGSAATTQTAAATVEGGGGAGNLSVFWQLNSFPAGHWYIDIKILTVLGTPGANEYQRRFFVHALADL